MILKILVNNNDNNNRRDFTKHLLFSVYEILYFNNWFLETKKAEIWLQETFLLWYKKKFQLSKSGIFAVLKMSSRLIILIFAKIILIQAQVTPVSFSNLIFINYFPLRITVFLIDPDYESRSDDSEGSSEYRNFCGILNYCWSHPSRHGSTKRRAYSGWLQLHVRYLLRS